MNLGRWQKDQAEFGHHNLPPPMPPPRIDDAILQAGTVSQQRNQPDNNSQQYKTRSNLLQTDQEAITAPSLDDSRAYQEDMEAPFFHHQHLPGAVRVSGINQGSSQNGRRAPQPYNLPEETDKRTVLAYPITEVVPSNNDELLVDRILAAVTQRSDVRLSETNVVPVQLNDYDMLKTKGSKKEEHYLSRLSATSMIIIGIVIVVVVAVVIVTAVVLLSRSNDQSPSPLHPSPKNAATESPTSAPISRLEALRSLLLNQSVSAQQDLDHQQSPQFRALDWLANRDQAKLNVSTATLQTIVNRYILAAFYYATGGEYWRSQSNFLSSKDICGWNADAPAATYVGTSDGLGVSCYPMRIEFESNKLRGTILSELGKLSGLVLLRLWDSFLSGTIPTELAGLSTLTTLIIGFNNLNGTIPTILGQMSHQLELSLYDNHLTGTIPTELGQLKQVTLLGLVNSLVGTIPSELGQLSQLELLVLNSNFLTGKIPTVIGALPTLQRFFVYNNSITGNIDPSVCDRSTPLQICEADCASKVSCSCCSQCY